MHSKHYWLHFFSGLSVFLLGIAADIGIGELRFRWPHKVRWSSNQVINDYTLPLKSSEVFWMTNKPSNIELGFSEDGIVYWRHAK